MSLSASATPQLKHIPLETEIFYDDSTQYTALEFIFRKRGGGISTNPPFCLLLPDNQTSVAAFIPYRFLQETQFGILTVVPSFLNFLEAELLYLADHLP